MSNKTITPGPKVLIKGDVTIPGDTEMAIISLWAAFLLPGEHKIENLPNSSRTTAVLNRLKEWGVEYSLDNKTIELITRLAN